MAKIIKALEAHDIEYKWDKDDLCVLEVSCLNGVASEKWINTRNWSIASFMAWLGY